MMLQRSVNHLKSLKEDRLRDVLPVPNGFFAPAPIENGARKYELAEAVTVEGIASFENTPMTVELRPRSGALPVIALHGNTPGESEAHALPLVVEHLEKGKHNIQLGPVRVIEHPLAMLTALNLDLDFHLNAASFPLFDNCNAAFVDALREKTRDAGPSRFVTPRDRFALEFQDGYVVLEPDDGEHRLILDHQIAYPGKSVGKQRIIASMHPEFFAFICDARTPSFRSPEETREMLDLLGDNSTGRSAVTRENVLFADENRLYNARSKFDVQVGGATVNYEFMSHELQDIIAWLKFVEVKYGAKFTGRMTTYRFSHDAQVDAARFVCADVRMNEIGLEFDG